MLQFSHQNFPTQLLYVSGLTIHGLYAYMAMELLHGEDAVEGSKVPG